jgi:hypothetical protein
VSGAGREGRFHTIPTFSESTSARCVKRSSTNAWAKASSFLRDHRNARGGSSGAGARADDRAALPARPLDRHLAFDVSGSRLGSAQPSVDPCRRLIVPTPHRYSGGVRTRNAWSAAGERGIEISGAVPFRTTSTMSFATSSGSSRTNEGPVTGKPSVGEGPGFTLVTRMPSGLSSW